MLKKETIDLLNLYNITFKDVFSICIGKSFLHQSRFIDFLGKYNSWHTDVKKGILNLDDNTFNVEYIGTTSISDNFWYSSEIEKNIPNEYVNLMIQTRKIMQSLNLNNFVDEKISLNKEIQGYNLSMIYLAFAPQNVTYFCGSGDTSIYMFVKNLPLDIFKKINSVEFTSIVIQIISTFEVNHKLMLKALLYENELNYKEEQNNIIAIFDENSAIKVEFDENDFITNISGNLN